MDILMLSVADYACSGHKLCDAINLYTDHNIRIYTGQYHNKFNMPMNRGWDEVTNKNRKDVQDQIDKCDIVHLKGDWPAKDGYLGLKIMHKPIVITVSGSHFRKKEYGGHGKFNPGHYKNVYRTAFTPDLLYPEFDGVWTPHPIDSKSKQIEWKISDPPVFIHVPSNKDMKYTWFIDSVLDKVSKHRKIKFGAATQIGHKQAMAIKRRATIYCDQFKVGFYGNSALEAMQYGIPVLCWMTVKNPACPVISVPELKVDLWVKKIIEVLDSDMKELAAKTKMWCDMIHSYQAVAELWNNIYNAL